jgi:hypothetical protein
VLVIPSRYSFNPFTAGHVSAYNPQTEVDHGGRNNTSMGCMIKGSRHLNYDSFCRVIMTRSGQSRYDMYEVVLFGIKKLRIEFLNVRIYINVTELQQW